MFLTYSEYKELGGALKETDFNRAEIAARMKINALTFNRIRDENPVRQAVKFLVLELVERGYCGALDGDDVISGSSGLTSTTVESKKGKAEAIIKEYLSGEEVNGVPLIGRGGIQFASVVRT